MSSMALLCPQDKIQLLMTPAAFAVWPPCISSFSHLASFPVPLCDHTADSSLNMPHSLLLQVVPLPRNLLP